MSHSHMRTPVAFFIFNRPDTTARVFEAISQAAPTRLLVVADGPRADRLGEAERCAAVRAVIDRVDWPCEVSVNFSETNLGCKRRVSSGLDWVFQNVEEAVILEDDCVPDQSFFRFCEELLARYRCDDRIAMISGNNFQFGIGEVEESYYFSRRPHIWGWATWRRTWRRYDVEMTEWPRLRGRGWLNELFPEKRLVRYWSETFDEVYRGDLDTWDHQFTFSCLLHGALCIMPSVNLVSNIGFGEDATHTKVADRHAAMPAGVMQFPLRHPREISRNVFLDSQIEKNISLPLRRALGLDRLSACLLAQARRLLRSQAKPR